MGNAVATSGGRDTSSKCSGGRNRVRRDPRPTAVDLFCGCGGLTAGLKEAGFRVLGALDVDRLAMKTFRANHPGVVTWRRDIGGLSVPMLRRKLKLATGGLDLLAGCPPCQGFSTMRTLNGALDVEDRRNDLIKHFLRFVKGLRPRAVMMENVPGLAEDARFEHFCETLRRLGYTVSWDILDAKDYGVPQRRRRLILLAGLGGKIEFAPIDPIRMKVGDFIKDLPSAGRSGDPAHDVKERRSERIMKLITRIPKDGGSRTDLPASAQLACHRRCDGFKDVYGRMAWGKEAPTITGGCFNPSKGRFLHPEENRAITLREAALLQSFPKDYVFPDCSNKSAVALLIGNAIPPEFIRRHALKIIPFLTGLVA